MKPFIGYAIGLWVGAVGIGNAFAGAASSNASASNGWDRGGGTATAAANYDTQGELGWGTAQTRTRTGTVNLARGWSIGFDEDGIDFSYSHAIAGRVGPAYAGTFNLSIGYDGDIEASYGGAVARGGQTRSVQAGGMTRSGPDGTAVAMAGGNTWPGGRVDARTDTYSRPATGQRLVRVANVRRR